MEALRLPVLSVLCRQRAPLRFCTGHGRWLVFNIHKYTQKTVSDQFFANATFSFFSCLFLAAAEVEPGGRVCVGTAATPVQGQSCLLSNFIHHVLVCTAQQ